MATGHLKEIHRFPVKSVLGESLTSVAIHGRGLIGDRFWAIRNLDGKFGSGKTTRRFVRMDGLFRIWARYDGDVPVVTMPDGAVYRGDNPTIHGALSNWVGTPVTLAHEKAVSHFDEGPVSIVTTASLRAIGERLGRPVDPRRVRANLVVDVPGEGFVENSWINRKIHVGSDVVLRVVAPLQRCVMLGFAQDELPEDADILQCVAQENNATLGVFATVEVGGIVHVNEKISIN